MREPHVGRLRSAATLSSPISEIAANRVVGNQTLVKHCVPASDDDPTAADPPSKPTNNP